MLARQLRKACGQQAGRDIPADIARHARGKAHRHAVQRAGFGRVKERLRLKRRGGDAAHAVSGEEVLHDGVADERDLAQRVRVAPAAHERALDQCPDLFAAALREFLQPVRLLERILDAADDVRPVGRLCVPAALGGELRAGREVIQPRDDGRRAEVDGGGAARAPRLTGGTRHARRGTPLTGTRHLPQRPFPPQAAGME